MRNSKIKTEKGFVNIHIATETKQMFISDNPYSTKEEADKAIVYGLGIEKVGCFEIEYTKLNNKNK